MHKMAENDDAESLSSLDSVTEKEIRRSVVIARRKSEGQSEEELQAGPPDDSKEETKLSSEEERLRREEEEEKRKVELETGQELIQAARQGNLDEVKDIISFAQEEELDILECRVPPLSGSDPAIHWTGFTAILSAARNGHVDVVRYLQEVGSDVEAKDQMCYMTPLMWAAYYNRVEVVSLLKTVNPNDVDAQSRTALIIAADQGHMDTVEILVWNSSLDAVDASGSTPLIAAVKAGAFPMAKLLCDYSANIEAKDIARRTPLMHAARWGFIKTLKLLIKRGADVDARDKTGWTALMLASRWNHPACVSVLLESDPSLTTRDRVVGKNAVMWAAEKHRDVTVLKMLLSVATEEVLACKDIYGHTALQLVVNVEAEALIKDRLAELAEGHSDDDNDDSDNDDDDDDEL